MARAAFATIYATKPESTMYNMLSDVLAERSAVVSDLSVVVISLSDTQVIAHAYWCCGETFREQSLHDKSHQKQANLEIKGTP